MDEHRSVHWFPDDDDFDFEWDPITWRRRVRKQKRKRDQDQQQENSEQGDSGMSSQEIQQLMMAVKALMKAVERSLATESYDGIADTMVDNYRALHTKIVEHYPDDYYVTEVLTVKIPDGATDRQKVSLVQLAASQMQSYLRSLHDDGGFRYSFSTTGPRRGRRRGPRGPMHGHDHGPGMHGGPGGDFGREISEEIMNFTKETLRRALSKMDEAMDFDEEHVPPRPPTPPAPPQPPKSPKQKRRIQIDLGELEDEDEDDTDFV